MRFADMLVTPRSSEKGLRYSAGWNAAVEMQHDRDMSYQVVCPGPACYQLVTNGLKTMLLPPMRSCLLCHGTGRAPLGRIVEADRERAAQRMKETA